MAGNYVINDVEMSNTESLPVNAGAVETNGECLRVVKLRHAFEKTVVACMSTASFSLFKKFLCTRDLHVSSSLLRKAHEQFQHKFQQLMQNEFEVMLREENMVELLTQFDDISKSDQHTTQHQWRPTGEPVDNVSAHLLPGLNELKQRIECCAREAELEADRLSRCVVERRKLIASLQTQTKNNEQELIQMCEQLREAVSCNVVESINQRV